ncbi:unnamed protein product [Arabidopsis thaliana]|uniref:Uncharacterized protein n=1 Tax=Arabidopsis thaliana TaxID=3702 RepID=A0A654FUD4_ARATH|nr:unnamed protein product [Arabidopsis thaliana]
MERHDVLSKKGLEDFLHVSYSDEPTITFCITYRMNQSLLLVATWLQNENEVDDLPRKDNRSWSEKRIKDQKMNNMQLQLCQTVNPPVTNNILTLTCDISELINLHDEGFNGFDPSMRPKRMILLTRLTPQALYHR